MLLQLACALLVAIVFFGDPRVRSSYDVFGLALLAAAYPDRFGLEDVKGETPLSRTWLVRKESRRGLRTPPG